MTSSSELAVLGWREWVGLPRHGVEWVKAKVDTGARTSSLHAFDIRPFDRDGEPWVRFEVHPWQRSTRSAVTLTTRVIDERLVRSSSGEAQVRPVVRLPVRIGGIVAPVELTLTRRDAMGFRMLLGRQALRRRFVVDPARSYLGGRPPKETREANLAPEDDGFDDDEFEDDEHEAIEKEDGQGSGAASPDGSGAPGASPSGGRTG